MATLKIGSLVISIGADTSDLKKAKKEVNSSTKAMRKAFLQLGAAIAVVFSIRTATAIVRIIDNMTRFQGKLRALTRTDKEFNRVFAETLRIANDIGISMGAVTTTFQRFSIIKDTIGANNEQMLRFSETIQKLGILSGATGQEVAATSIQISQALANNFESSAQEINSIREQMVAVAILVEKELGLTAGTFKKALTEGEVSAVEFFNAIISGSKRTDEEFAKLPITVERATQAFINERDVALKMIDDVNEGNQSLVDFINLITSKIDGWALAYIDFSLKAQLATKKFVAEAKALWNTLGIEIEKIADDLVASWEGAAERITSNMAIAAKEVELSWTEAADFVNPVLADIFGSFQNFSKTPGAGKFAELAEEFRESADAAKKVRAELADLFEIEGLRGDREQTNADARRVAANEQIVQINAVKDANIQAAEDEFAARSRLGGRITPRDRPDIGGIPDKPAFQVDDRDVLAGNVSGVDRIIADMGDETQEILNQLQERNQAILDATREGEQQREDLIRSSREKFNRDLMALENANLASALNMTGSFLDQLFNVLSAGGKKQSALLKALFLAAKAVHVAEIIANTEVGAAKAVGLLGPFGIPLAQVIRATGYASAGLVAGLAVGQTITGGGRQSGGDVFAGMMHPINENGDPEVLQQGARQFLLPGSKGGTVVSGADMRMGSGGGQPNVTVINSGPPLEVQDVQMTRNEIIIRIDQASRETKSEIDASLSSGRGTTSRSLRQGFNMERRTR